MDAVVRRTYPPAPALTRDQQGHADRKVNDRSLPSHTGRTPVAARLVPACKSMSPSDPILQDTTHEEVRVLLLHHELPRMMTSTPTVSATSSARFAPALEMKT